MLLFGQFCIQTQFQCTNTFDVALLCYQTVVCAWNMFDTYIYILYMRIKMDTTTVICVSPYTMDILVIFLFLLLFGVYIQCGSMCGLIEIKKKVKPSLETHLFWFGNNCYSVQNSGLFSWWIDWKTESDNFFLFFFRPHRSQFLDLIFIITFQAHHEYLKYSNVHYVTSRLLLLINYFDSKVAFIRIFSKSLEHHMESHYYWIQFIGNIA